MRTSVGSVAGPAVVGVDLNEVRRRGRAAPHRFIEDTVERDPLLGFHPCCRDRTPFAVSVRRGWLLRVCCWNTKHEQEKVMK